jgi:hypothetical protein
MNVSQHDPLCPYVTLGLECYCHLIHEVQRAERLRLMALGKNGRKHITDDWNCTVPTCNNKAHWDWAVELLCDAHDEVLNLSLRLQQAGELIGEAITTYANSVMNNYEIDDDEEYLAGMSDAVDIAISWGKDVQAW